MTVRYLLCALGLLFAAESAAAEPDLTPVLIRQADGSLKLLGAAIHGIPGLVYVCLGSHDVPRQILCLAFQPDGSVLEAIVTRTDIET